MFVLSQFALPDGWQNRILFSLHSSLLQKSFYYEELQLPSLSLISKGTSNPSGEEVFDWVIFSDLLPLNDAATPTLLHRSPGSRCSPDISLCPLLSRPLLLLVDASGPGLWPLIHSTNSPSFSGFSPQWTSPSLQFSESWLGWLCLLLLLSLSFCRGILVFFHCCCSLYFSDTECGQIFHSFRPHQTPT